MKADGTAWAWGGNDYGQLGIGPAGYQAAPVQVTGLSNVNEIATGYVHALARKSDGSVSAWGDNSKGQLGDGTKNGSNTPVSVGGLTGVIAVTAGNYHSIALKNDLDQIPQLVAYYDWSLPERASRRAEQPVQTR